MIMETHIWGNTQEVPKVNGEAKSEILVHEPSILEQIHNRIFFYAEIGRANILKLNRALREQSNLIQHDQIVRGAEAAVPILLHINSYGGALFSGLAGMDEILNCGVEVRTIVDGCSASAATLLSVVGKKRYINRHAYMMIHQLSSMMWGKYSEFVDEQKNLDRLMGTIKEIYGEYTKVPQDELAGILDHDIWWDAETCLKYSLVDEILK